MIMMICPVHKTAMAGNECPRCGIRQDVESESFVPIYFRPKSELSIHNKSSFGHVNSNALSYIHIVR